MLIVPKLKILDASVHLSSKSLLNTVKILLLSASLLHANAGIGEEQPTLMVNQTALRLPLESGFSTVYDQASPIFKRGQLLAPPSNKLLALWVGDAPKDPRAEHRPDRYGMLQILREAEGMLVSRKEFAKVRTGMASGFANFSDKDIQRYVDLVRNQVQTYGADRSFTLPTMQAGKPVILETLADEENSWSAICSMQLVTSKDGQSETTPMLMGISFVLCKGKLLYLYTYSKFHQASDYQWIKQMTTSLRKDFLEINR